MLLAATPAATPPVIVIGDEDAIAVANFLRARGIKVEIPFAVGLKNGLKYANRRAAIWAVLANPEGLILKHLGDGAQSSVTLGALPDLLAS
jgi:histidyl-tRNA synthetase